MTPTPKTGTTPLQNKITIIGSGPAGCTAAIYAARAGLEPIMLEGLQPGGQLTITNEVENYPPFASTTGPGLMAEMRSHCLAAGVVIVARIVERIETARRGGYICFLDDGSQLVSTTLVIATGARANWLGLPSEDAFKGRGVSACATCDGYFYRGRDVIVVGGGNTAVEEALYLSNLANKVTLIHRRDTLRAEKVLQTRLMSKNNVSIVWNAEIREIVGDHMGVTGAVIRRSDGTLNDIAAHGIFVAIGHAPETSIVGALLALDPAGYIPVVPGTSITSAPGIFAAGDVADPVYRQAITSAGMGCQAALDAERYLSGL